MTGCRGCLGRFVLLILLAWAIEEIAQILGWSDAAPGDLFLIAVGLLAIRGSARRQRRETVRITHQPVALPTDRKCLNAPRRWETPRGHRPPRDGRTLANPGTGRARDPLPAQLRFRVLQRDGFRCRYCGRSGSAPGVVLHVDHVVPVIARGATIEDNLLTACEECNLGKGTRMLVRIGS